MTTDSPDGLPTHWSVDFFQDNDDLLNNLGMGESWAYGSGLFGPGVSARLQFAEQCRVQGRSLLSVHHPGGGLFASRQSPMVRLGNSMLTVDDDATSVAEAVRLREALDPLLVEDALEYASDHDVAALRNQLDDMKVDVGNVEGTAFARAERNLYARIADISPSAILRSLYPMLLDVIESTYCRYGPSIMSIYPMTLMPATNFTPHWSMRSPTVICVPWT